MRGGARGVGSALPGRGRIGWTLLRVLVYFSTQPVCEKRGREGGKKYARRLKALNRSLGVSLAAGYLPLFLRSRPGVAALRCSKARTACGDLAASLLGNGASLPAPGVLLTDFLCDTTPAEVDVCCGGVTGLLTTFASCTSCAAD